MKDLLIGVSGAVLTAVLFWFFGVFTAGFSTVTVPQGVVVAFNKESCPLGWTEYKQAYGRFIRGIDRSNQGIDPETKTRTIGSLQEDLVGPHNHKYYGMKLDSNCCKEGKAWGAHFVYAQNRETENWPSKETRPKNVSLLYCEKE